MTKVAIVQEPPVLLEREKTIAKAVEKIAEAAARGAGLIVFNEAFVPGYPAWIWRLKPSGDWGLSETLHTRLVLNAVDLSSDQMQQVSEALRNGERGPILDIQDADGDGVVISTE